MILLTRFPKGERLALNPDLVERAEALPDTVLTMTDGTHYVVEESVEELIEIVKDYRAAILGRAQRYAAGVPGDAPGPLRLVRDQGSETGSGTPTLAGPQQ